MFLPLNLQILTFYPNPDKFIILTLPRCDLDYEQLEDFKNHAKESGMNIEEFLVEMPKVIEGYSKLVDDKMWKNNMQDLVRFPIIT